MGKLRKSPRVLVVVLVSAMALLVGASIANARAAELPTVPAVLGSDGTVFRLHEGDYGDLFPNGAEADRAHPVLALDVRCSGGTNKRLLVPGTETSDLESSASMVFEDKTGVVYLAWETLFNGQHPLLQLITFDGTEWSELIEITSNVFADKGSPQLVVQREADLVAEEDTEELRSRTTLHLTWWEEANGVSRKLHALIILDEGEYIGWAPILDLSNYVLESDAFAPLEVPGLETTLALQAGRDHRTVVSGYVNPVTHRLITLEIEALSQVISQIAEFIRAQIVVIGLRAGSRAELAELARAEVLTQGTAFHEATRQFLADQIAAMVESSDVEFTPAGIHSLAEMIRAQIVVIGLRIGRGGLSSPAGSEIIAVGDSALSEDPQHYYQISVASDRPVPEVGGTADLLLSESGRNVIVTWEDENNIYYRESVDDGWSETTVIELVGELDRETVYRMLEERVRAD